MLYVLEGLTFVTPEQMERAGLLVTEQRRSYAARYRFHKDRVQSIFSFLLLQYGLKEEYGITRKPILNYSKGKPVLTGLEWLHFNLSHCQLAAACGLSHAPVGVDVQDWTRGHLSVAKQVCSLEELALLKEESDPEIAFAKLWTRKESYGKYTGQGIIYPMKETNLWEASPLGTVMETFLFQGYALSYCAEKELKIKKVTVDDLLQGREME